MKSETEKLGTVKNIVQKNTYIKPNIFYREDLNTKILSDNFIKNSIY
jgi:hypothetical protein